MKKRRIIALSSLIISYTMFLFSMDCRNKKTEAIVVHIAQPNHENFDDLVRNNAVFLASLVAHEESGNYCDRLHRSIVVLEKNEHKINKDILKKDCDFETVEFIRMISDRRRKTSDLIYALHDAQFFDVITICSDNRFIANAYSFQRNYGGITTPLHYALWRYASIAEEKHYDLNLCIECLMNYGANVNSYDHKNEVPLHKAHTIKQIMLLWKRGARNDMVNDQGMTPLMKYIKNEKSELAQALIVGGSDLFIKDVLGDTALHYAVLKGNVHIVEHLLSKMQVDPHYGFDNYNHSGLTPGMMAYWAKAEVKNVMEKYMLSHIYKVGCANNRSRTRYFLEKYPWLNYGLIDEALRECCCTQNSDGAYIIIDTYALFKAAENAYKSRIFK